MILGHLGVFLRRSWNDLKASKAILGPSSGDLGGSWEPVGTTFGPSWALLDGLGCESKRADENVDVKMTTLES